MQPMYLSSARPSSATSTSPQLKCHTFLVKVLLKFILATPVNLVKVLSSHSKNMIGNSLPICWTGSHLVSCPCLHCCSHSSYGSLPSQSMKPSNRRKTQKKAKMNENIFIKERIF